MRDLTIELGPPPQTVPIADLGDYLRAFGLTINRHYLDARGRLVVECLPTPPISTDIDPERTPTP